MFEKQTTEYFDVILERSEQVYADESFIDLKNLKIRRVNKTPTLVGPYHFKREFDDEISVDRGRGIYFTPTGRRIPLFGLQNSQNSFLWIYQKR